MGLHFLSKSRGLTNLCSRIGTIFSRFGISSGKFAKLLFEYSDITSSLGCVPTFPITAVILKRHPGLIKKLGENGAEFAIHGYIHTDYRELSFQEQLAHYEKAINIFKMYGVPYTGYRAPFLRTNSETTRALIRLEFAYDSSQAAYWNVIGRNGYSDDAWSEHGRLLDFYQPQPAQDFSVLPRSNNGILEIPVSIPDDEVMVERLGIRDARKIGKIWGAVLQRIYDRGELFTLQLHPERIKYCEEALADVVRQARSLNPPVWIATLGQIAGWWQEKERFIFEIEALGNGGYKVHAGCSERATVLFKNCRVNAMADKWCDGYQTIASRDFVLESPVRPVIGLAPNSAPEAVNFLKSEGYIAEKSEQPDKYRLYLGNLVQFSEADKKPLTEKIEGSGAPLLRYWRWPDQTRMALTVTGDIDSITLIDFVLRVCENWWQRRRQGEN
jgi:hypothetical protein